MLVIPYKITLLEPAILTALEGDPNESVSFDYIPGSVLRGAIIGKYMSEKGLKELDAADKSVRDLFFNGSTRYLNAYPHYPQDYAGKRALPVPLSWHQDKKAVSKEEDNEPAPVYDFAINNIPRDIDQPISVKKRFYTRAEDYVRFVSPKYQLSVHTARNRRYGRALRLSSGFIGSGDEAYGAVYRYKALAAGQSFKAAIICDNDKDVEILLSLLEGDVFLGGSRTAGYGRAEICIENSKQPFEEWREAWGEMEVEESGNLIITFLSDALVRDECGQYTASTEALTDIFQDKLKIRLEQPEKSFVRTRVVGGFNRKWGLPLPQALAVKMGSVLVYHLTAGSSLDKNLLARLEAQGIGERRVEGFGRLAFNCNKREKLSVQPKSSVPMKAPEIKDEESRAIAGRIVARIFQQRLESKLIASAKTVSGYLAGDEDKKKDLPRNAQISRFRSVILNELMKENEKIELQKVKNYLSDIESRKSAREQFEKARIKSKSLLEWLKKILDDKSDDQDYSKKLEALFGFSIRDVLGIGGIKPQLNEPLYKRYLLRYIDAILASAVKEKNMGGS